MEVLVWVALFCGLGAGFAAGQMKVFNKASYEQMKTARLERELLCKKHIAEMKIIAEENDKVLEEFLSELDDDDLEIPDGKYSSGDAAWIIGGAIVGKLGTTIAKTFAESHKSPDKKNERGDNGAENE